MQTLTQAATQLELPITLLKEVCEILGLQVQPDNSYNPVSVITKKEIDLIGLCKAAKAERVDIKTFAAKAIQEYQKTQQANGASVQFTPDEYFKRRFGVDPSSLQGDKANSVLGTIYSFLNQMESTANNTAAVVQEYFLMSVSEKLKNGFELPGESSGAREAVDTKMLAFMDWNEGLVNWGAPMTLEGSVQKQLKGTATP